MIIFSEHALLKLKQRGISKITVKGALYSPDYKFSSYSDRMVIYKKFDKLYLKVIYRMENGDTIVITQHWEKKPKLNKF